jgi:integrase
MPRVRLYTRPTISGRRKYVPADPKLKNNQGTFYLRYTLNGKRVWETAHTKTYTFALAAAKQKESTLLLHEAKATPELPRPKARLTLEDQRDTFLELKDLTKKTDGTRLDKETLSAYRQETAGFLSVSKKLYADEIDGMDLRRYMAALEEKGDAHRTIVNKYTSVGSFLKFCGIDHKELLPKGERPRPQDEDPEAYTLEEMLKFLPAVKRYRDRLFFEFLLKTGARTREATNARWTDLVGGNEPVFRIQNHDETSFRTKTGKSRVVPLEKSLYEKLMMWKEQNPGKKLIFGTKSDKPDTHFLEVCKETALRTGLNCGECVSLNKKTKLPRYDKKGLITCKTHPVCEHWYDHKFRDTFCTWSLRAGVDIRTVQGWVGHYSIQQTERYLEKGKGAYAQKGINMAFGVSLTMEVYEGRAVQ